MTYEPWKQTLKHNVRYRGAQVWVRYYLHLLIASHATARYITNYDVTKRNYRITKSIVETKSIITYQMFTLQSERDRK